VPAPVPTSTAPVGSVDAALMREVDRLMIEELGIELLQMMENAGRNLARLAIDRFDVHTAAVLAGSGGNGGGGMTAARHLANAGVATAVVLARRTDELMPVPRDQLDILERMGVPIVEAIGEVELIIDALVGYSLDGDPRGRTAALIVEANEHAAPVLSLDIPSGVDATTGRVGEPAIVAAATLTLALPKTGMAHARANVGELYVADISVPPSVYDDLGVGPAPDFRPGPVLRLL